MRACLDLTAWASPDRHRGIGRYLQGLCGAARNRSTPGLELLALIARGLRAEVVSLGEGWSWLEENTAPVFAGSEGYHLWRRLLLTPILRRARVDLYHSPEAKGRPLLPAPRVVVTCHDLIPYLEGGAYLPRLWPRPAQGWLERFRYRTPDHVIAISPRTRDDLRQVTGLGGDRVTMVLHGIDRSLFQPRPAAEEREALRPFTGGSRYFLYVGAFDPRRQVELLLRAFAEAAPQLDEHLLLCGSPSPAQRRQLQRLLEELRLADRVRLAERLGAQQLAALYRQATAHVMLSRHEGFGFTLFEAMACGCPVLALDLSPARELAGAAALLLPPDRRQISEALQQLASRPALRDDLRRRGLQQVQRFSWSRCAEETLQVYRRVLA